MDADRTVNYRMNRKLKLQFGESLYVVGSTVPLGHWDPLKAVCMNCLEQKYWTAEVPLPVSEVIQYKYFVGPTWRNALDKTSIQWVDHQNKILYFDSSDALHFTKENEQRLTIMSFNLRFENKKDVGKHSWTERKPHVTQLILSYLPDFVGVQEPKTSQREYLQSMMGQFYEYFGKPRDLHKDEESGIFIRRDKFIVREDGYIWINENRKEGAKGFGSNLPRYFTYVLVSPLTSASRLIMVINTHLDHQSQSSRLNGVKLISTVIKQINQKYEGRITNVFVTGDFNTCDNDPIFDNLTLQSHKLESMRLALPESQSDFGQTFNGFSKLTSIAERVVEFFKFSSIAKIDHIFLSTEDYQPTKFQVIRTHEHILSDHHPIMGTLLNRN